MEAPLKALRSPRLLHLATHGFFLDDQRLLRAPSGEPSDTPAPPPGGLENPLLRSGLALAGANTWLKHGALPPEAEDGLLTAEDVTGMDLSATELVVLSACETGLGQVQIGEGVFGLRRAFVLAAGLEALQQAITGSLNNAGADTRWLFYFAGHGKAIDGQGYLIPADTAKGQTDTYLPISWLLEQCRASACAEVLIILDACYSGSALLRPDDLSDYLPPNTEADRLIQIITSGNPDQPVLDGGGQQHSVFTQALLDALEGWVGVHETDGRVRFSSLLPFMKHGLADRLQAAGASPWQQQTVGGNILSSRSGRDFVFLSQKPRLSPTLVRQGRDGRAEQRLQAMNNLPQEAGEHPERRPAAVDLAAAHLRRSPQARSLIDPAAWQEPDAGVRAAAAQALGELSAAETWPDLAAALDDQLPVAQAAAQALGKLGVVVAAGLMARAGGSSNAASDQPVALAQAGAEISSGGRFRHELIRYLKEQWDDQLLAPGLIHRHLAQWPAAVWINGAYDRLLVKALSASSVTQGGDMLYVQPGKPVVVNLLGNLSAPESLVVLEEDYDRLRQDERDRQLLVGYFPTRLLCKLPKRQALKPLMQCISIQASPNLEKRSFRARW